MFTFVVFIVLIWKVSFVFHWKVLLLLFLKKNNFFQSSIETRRRTKCVTCECRRSKSNSKCMSISQCVSWGFVRATLDCSSPVSLAHNFLSVSYSCLYSCFRCVCTSGNNLSNQYLTPYSVLYIYFMFSFIPTCTHPFFPRICKNFVQKKTKIIQF